MKVAVRNWHGNVDFRDIQLKAEQIKKEIGVAPVESGKVNVISEVQWWSLKVREDFQFFAQAVKDFSSYKGRGIRW